MEETTLLATIKRGEDAEDRVELATYKGHKFVNIRGYKFWGGQWHPDARRGITVRLRDLRALISALADAERASADLSGEKPERGWAG